MINIVRTTNGKSKYQDLKKTSENVKKENNVDINNNENVNVEHVDMERPKPLFSKEETETHVSNRGILSYATGLAGQNISYSFISGRLTYFYENHAVSQRRASVVGKLMSATYVWDAVNDVLIGAYVDSRRHKPFQKLRPYLLYLPPVIGLFGALMFVNVGGGDLLKEAGIAADQLAERTVERYPEIRNLLYDYLMKNGSIDPEVIGNPSVIGSWSFVPAALAQRALDRDMKRLFRDL